MAGDDDGLERVRAAMDRTKRLNWLVAGFFLLLSLLPILLFTDEMSSRILVASFFWAFAALMFWLGLRMSPQRNPAALALFHDPGSVSHVVHYISSSSSGAMKMHWIRIQAHGKSFGIKVAEDEILAMAEILARRCPNAKIEVPGFHR